MTRLRCLAVLIVLFLFATPAPAASSVERYWSGFKSFWSTTIGSVGGIVGIILLTGAAALFIITRGKWLK